MIALLVLFAAFLHAVWNSVVKNSPSGFQQMALSQMIGAIVALLFIPGSWLPNAASIPYLVASVVIHFFYFILLAGSYRTGEFSLVYPIARGIGPISVALCAPFLQNEHLSAIGTLGLCALSTGVIATGLTRERHGMNGRKALLFAVLTGITIGAYTIVDGIGARASGDAIQFVRSLYIAEGLTCFLAVLLTGPRTGISYAKRYWRSALFNSVVASIAYGIVIWATTLAPIAYVSALRETSVVFAVLIGIFLMKESYGRERLKASVLVVIGAILLHF